VQATRGSAIASLRACRPPCHQPITPIGWPLVNCGGSPVECGFHVGQGALIGEPARQLVRAILVLRHLAPIQIGRNRHVSLLGERCACSLTQSFRPHHSCTSINPGRGVSPAAAPRTTTIPIRRRET